MNPTTDASQARPFEFIGNGGEYFRIWIVNLALTIITVGIYSAWAKVRRLQYFYRNTTLSGNSFDYHGNPVAILKGRVIGIGLLMIYNAAFAFSIPLGMLIFLLLLAVFPWLIQRSLCFRLHNSSYRGLRFRFAGTLSDAYEVFLVWPFVSYLTLGGLMPLAHHHIKAYQHNFSTFGTAPFSFDAKVGDFYRIYLKVLGMMFLLGILIPLIAVAVSAGAPELFTGFNPKNKEKMGQMVGLVFLLIVVFYLLFFLLVGPWFAARTQNLVWNHTALGPHTFSSKVRARDLLLIYLTNFLGIILTLGLFKPFADIRLARYRLTHMALNAQSGLDEFFAQEQQSVTALGEETANVFDVDISFFDPGTLSTPGTISATYFDGRTAIAHAITLTLTDGVLGVRGESIARDEPISSLRVSEPMGAAPRLISFADGAHCEVRDHAGMARLLEYTGFEDGFVVRLQRYWRWAFVSIVVTLACVFAGYHWGLPAASEWLAFQVPEAALSRMGGSVLDVLDRTAFSPSKLPDARQQVLRSAFERLAAPGDAKPRYVLHFRHGGAIGANAMALPDGSIVVTDQLVALSEHDDEILAVLTHELGHINRRHGLRMLIQGSIVAFVVSFYMGDVSSVAAGLPTLLLQARYSRNHEREADQYGAAMLKSNGLSPRLLADMLAKLEASHRAKSSQGGKDRTESPSQSDDQSGAGAYLKSHPATQERIDALNNTAQ